MWVKPETFQDAMDIIDQLEYTISLRDNEINDLKDEIAGLGSELEEAMGRIHKLENEKNV